MLYTCNQYNVICQLYLNLKNMSSTCVQMGYHLLLTKLVPALSVGQKPHLERQRLDFLLK